jgi:hypothetical protein
MSTCYQCQTQSVETEGQICASCLLQAQPPIGLGDKVAAVAHKLGFKQTPGCGCAERQRAMNSVNTNQSPLAVARDIALALAKLRKV